MHIHMYALPLVDLPCILCMCMLQFDRTPLYAASRNGHAEAVKVLLKFNAGVVNSSDTVSYYISVMQNM